MHFKTRVKHAVQQIAQGDYPAFVIASFGRSGSTLIYNAVLDGISAARMPIAPRIARRFLMDTAWQLDATSLRRGVVYKTHDYPGALSGRHDVKSIFLFGSVVDAALSVYSCRERYNNEWVEEHFRHLRSELEFDDLFKCDALRFQDQINAWCSYEGAEVLCLRYDSIWDYRTTLNNFCGFNVPLPPRRARVEKTPPPHILSAADAIYGPIDQIINALPDAFFSGRKKCEIPNPINNT